MKFGHIEIFVKEPLKSIEFYERILGMIVTEVQDSKFVWLKLDDNIFLLRPGQNNLKTNEYKSSNTGFVFYTNDVENTRQEMISNGLTFKGTDGSDNCLTFTDPDGNWFQLVNPNHT